MMRDDERMTVKPGMEAEYAEYVGKNQDGYGNCAVCSGAALGAALDRGETPEQAERSMCDSEAGKELSGFLAGCAVEQVAHFHPRGEEFRKWWNERYGIKPENDKGGVVNPAILTIG